VVAEEGIDNGVMLLMTRKVGWQKGKCTAHVSQDDYAIVIVDIQAEVIAMAVEFQLRFQSQKIFGRHEFFIKVVKPGLLSLESENEFTMIAIVKGRKYLITEWWREDPGEGNVVHCTCRPACLVVAYHHASFDFWGELILKRVSKNVFAAKENNYL
jgi:hypothetical protein